MQQDQHEMLEQNSHLASMPTMRDVLAIVFRQRWLLLVSFVAILLGIVFSGVLTPKYEAQMKILVRRERADPMISSQANAPSQSGGRRLPKLS